MINKQLIITIFNWVEKNWHDAKNSLVDSNYAPDNK